MSDNAEQFHTAWKSVFEEVGTKLLCTWHVDRAWKHHLSLIKSIDLQIKVYHNLRLLMEE